MLSPIRTTVIVNHWGNDVTIRIPRLGRALAALALSLAAVVIAAPGTAHAADNGLWSVFPTTVPGLSARPFFQPLLTPGVPLQDSLTITNKTGEPLTLQLYTADAFNTPEGGFASRPPQAPKRGMGSWITLSTDTVTVAPQSELPVPFTIDTPLDASPGDHAGSIIALNPTPTVNDAGQVKIHTVQAVGVRVYGRVAGKLTRSLDVTSMDVSTTSGIGSLFGGGVDTDVTYKVVNTGNTRVQPHATLSVSPLFGGSTDAKPIPLPELLPHGSAIVHQHVSSVMPFGRATAKVTITSEAPTVTAEASAWVIPWFLLLIVVLLVALLAWWLRRRRRHDEGSEVWAAVDEGAQP